MSKSCSLIRACGLTPSGQAISGDISEGYLAWPSSPAQLKSISLTSTSFVIMTFVDEGHQTPIRGSAIVRGHAKRPIILFLPILQTFFALLQQMCRHRHIP